VLLACARHGLYHGWRALRLPAGSAVLVPAFTCDTVTEPLKLAGAQLVFYHVCGDLSPDLEHADAILRRCPRQAIRALLWYHFVGIPAGISEAASFCRARGLFFIEDCAHTLPDGGTGAVRQPAGSRGDIAVFSLRKMLPVTNAGALVINNRDLLPAPAIRWQRADAAYAQMLRDKEAALRRRAACDPVAAADAIHRHVAFVSRMNAPRRAVREHARRQIRDADLPLAQMGRPLAPDQLSRQVVCRANLSAMARARRRNYRAYLQGIGDLALFPRLPPVSHTPALSLVSEFALGVFLAISLMSLQLWALAGMAGTLLLVLTAQTLLALGFAYFLAFRFLGRDYPAAVLTAGYASFVVGATPTAIATMTAVTKRYGPSPAAFIVLPLVSALFVDLANALVTQGFLTLWAP